MLAIAVAYFTRPLEAPPAQVEPEDHPLAAAPLDAGTHLSFVGVIVNSSTINLSPLQDGTISSIAARVGDEVKKGQILVTFESSELRHEVQMADAQLSRDDAELERAVLERRQADERLARALQARQHLNVDELSSAKYAARFASAAERALRARRTQDAAKVAQLRDRLDQRTLRAPYDSVVADRFVDPGAVAAPGSVILRLVGQGGWRVRFAIPEEAPVLPPDAGVQVRASTGEQWPAVVTEVAPGVDPASLTRFAEAQLLIDRGGPPFGARVRVTPGEAAPP